MAGKVLPVAVLPPKEKPPDFPFAGRVAGLGAHKPSGLPFAGRVAGLGAQAKRGAAGDAAGV